MQMEYCENGDLYDFINLYTQKQAESGAFSKGIYANDLDLLKSMYCQLIDAVRSLHNVAGYAHLDIKLENILIDNSGALKLCDFGFSSYSISPINKKVGTEAYMAPEIHEARLNPCKG